MTLKPTFHTFETIAHREAWDKAEWVHLLAPFLTGEAQRSYYSLSATESEDYKALKREILVRVGLSSVSVGQQFNQWWFNYKRPARVQIAQLTRLAQLSLLAGDPMASGGLLI